VVGDGTQVERVQFEGVERFSDSEITAYLYAGELGWLPDTRDQPFDEALMAADIQRIESLYAANGYHDARVDDVKVSQKDGRSFVKFFVHEGEPTVVKGMNFVWPGPIDPKIRQDVEAAAEFKLGDAFEISTYNATLGALRFALLTNGFPLADVSGKAEVDRVQHSARCTFNLVPGPTAILGEVRFEGLIDVPEDQVHREVEFLLGQAYSPARVAQMESAVKGLQVFRWVSAVPATEVVDGKTTILIRVSEADPHSVRIGAELEVDTVRWQEQLRASYTHTNLFGELTRLDLQMVLGWAQLPNFWETDLQGPVVSVRPEFSKKGLLERHLMWSLAPEFRLDLEEGYQYYSVGDRFGVSRWFKGMYRLGLNHTVDYVNFFNLSPELGANSSLLGRDFRDPYLLSILESQAAAYFVDSIIKPKNGAIIEGSFGVAASQIGSDFDFHRTALLLRGYWSPVDWFQLASRAKTGLIVPFGQNPSVPFNKRFYLGGASSVRGWGSRRLSPRLEECDVDGNCDSIPVGGYTMVQGNLELRFRVVKPLWLVAFADVGDVQSEKLTYKFEEWNYSAGPGVRLDTALGLVRLDAGFRLNDTGVYPDERAWGIYLGLGETL
jgi:outer membrane protein assembly factor BamA